MTTPSTKVLSTRIPIDEYFEIARIATKNNMNISDYVFMLIHYNKDKPIGQDNVSSVTEQQYRQRYDKLIAENKQLSNLLNRTQKELEQLHNNHEALKQEYQESMRIRTKQLEFLSNKIAENQEFTPGLCLTPINDIIAQFVK